MTLIASDSSDIITANRSQIYDDVKEKVYSRDIFNNN